MDVNQKEQGVAISQTPFRISFFGGGTDCAEYFNRHGGSVIGMAIDKYIYVVINSLERFSEAKIRLSYSRLEQVNSPEELQHKIANEVLVRHSDFTKGGFIDLHTFADLPASSGVGSSSSFTVGMLNALYFLSGTIRTAEQLSKEAIHIEREKLKENGGWQDQIFAAYGGFNRIDYLNNSFTIHPIVLSDEKINAFEKSCMLYFTGDIRSSSEIHNKISKSNKTARMHQIYKEMKKYVDEAYYVLSQLTSAEKMIEDLGNLIDESWKVKKKLSKDISNGKIDLIYKKGKEAGAYGGKICGAGSGGFFLFIVSEDKQESVKRALKDYKMVPISLEQTGSKIIYQKMFNKQYPYPLSRQKTGVSKVDSSPCITAVGTEGARRATEVVSAT